MDEFWRPFPVEGYEKVYKVSSTGRVMRVATQKILTTNCNGRYRSVTLSRFPGDKRIRREVHRLVAQAFLGDYPGLVVNHKDHDRYNNCVENLEWVTQAENLAHARAAGRLHTQRDEVGSFA